MKGEDAARSRIERSQHNTERADKMLSQHESEFSGKFREQQRRQRFVKAQAQRSVADGRGQAPQRLAEISVLAVVISRVEVTFGQNRAPLPRIFRMSGKCFRSHDFLLPGKLL